LGKRLIRIVKMESDSTRVSGGVEVCIHIHIQQSQGQIRLGIRIRVILGDHIRSRSVQGAWE
jgi:hypothetical protein